MIYDFRITNVEKTYYFIIKLIFYKNVYLIELLIIPIIKKYFSRKVYDISK